MQRSNYISEDGMVSCGASIQSWKSASRFYSHKQCSRHNGFGLHLSQADLLCSVALGYISYFCHEFINILTLLGERCELQAPSLLHLTRSSAVELVNGKECLIQVGLRYTFLPEDPREAQRASQFPYTLEVVGQWGLWLRSRDVDFRHDMRGA